MKDSNNGPPKCEMCKERPFTLLVDGVRMCITCYDDLRKKN